MNKRWTLAAILLCLLQPAPADERPMMQRERAVLRQPADLRMALDELDRGTNAILRRASPYSDEQRAAYNEWVLAYTQNAYAWHHNSTVLI